MPLSPVLRGSAINNLVGGSNTIGHHIIDK
jgi:hypothetical protein